MTCNRLSLCAKRLTVGVGEADAAFWNVSISVSFTVPSPEDGEPVTLAAAGGYVDHASGEKATLGSMYPAGSVDKFFTAVGAPLPLLPTLVILPRAGPGQAHLLFRS